jgi:hypothetical protein
MRAFGSPGSTKKGGTAGMLDALIVGKNALTVDRPVANSGG